MNAVFRGETNGSEADCLSWSTADVCLWPGHSAVEMVRPAKEGRKIQQGWKGEMRASLGPALLSSSQVHLWSVMDMMEIDFQVNCFVCLSRRHGPHCPPSPPRGHCFTLCSTPRSTSLIAQFNIPDRFGGLIHLLPSHAVLSITCPLRRPIR